MAAKTAMRGGSYNKRAVMKAVKEYKLLAEDQIAKLGELYSDLPKIEDPWEYEQQYRFKVLREQRVQLTEFLSGRSEIPSGSFVLAASDIVIDSGSNHSKCTNIFTQSRRSLCPASRTTWKRCTVKISSSILGSLS